MRGVMRVLLITSGVKGGTGKTTLAVNLAVILGYNLRTRAQYPVVLLDFSLDGGTASILMLGDYRTKLQHTLADYFTGKIRDPLQALYVKSWQVGDEIFNVVFSASISEKPIPIRASKFTIEELIRRVETSLNPLYTIIDTPAMEPQSEILKSLIELSTNLILIATPDHSSLKALSSLMSVIGELNATSRLLKPVLNMANQRFTKDVLTGRDWVELVREVVGLDPHVIPYDVLFPITRQAGEIECLKLSPNESLALNAIFDYADYIINAAPP